MLDPAKPLVTEREAAVIAQMSTYQFASFRHQGTGPEFHRYGPKCIRYARADVIRWKLKRAERLAAELERKPKPTIERRRGVYKQVFEVVELTGYDPVTKTDRFTVHGAYETRHAAEDDAKRFANRPAPVDAYLLPDQRFVVRLAAAHRKVDAATTIGQRAALT